MSKAPEEMQAGCWFSCIVEFKKIKFVGHFAKFYSNSYFGSILRDKGFEFGLDAVLAQVHPLLTLRVGLGGHFNFWFPGLLIIRFSRSWLK